MKRSSLDRISPMLVALRAHPALHEIRPTHFLLDGKEFVHFHDEDDGITADAILSKGRVSMPVNSAAEQAEFLERIEGSLASLRTRRRDRDRRRRGSKGA